MHCCVLFCSWVVGCRNHQPWIQRLDGFACPVSCIHQRMVDSSADESLFYWRHIRRWSHCEIVSTGKFSVDIQYQLYMDQRGKRRKKRHTRTHYLYGFLFSLQTGACHVVWRSITPNCCFWFVATHASHGWTSAWVLFSQGDFFFVFSWFHSKIHICLCFV